MLRGGTDAAVHCGACSCVGAGLEGRVATPKPSIPSVGEDFGDHLPVSDSGLVAGSPFILPGPRTQLSNALSFPASDYQISAFYKSFRIYLWSELAFELFRSEQLPSGTE